VVSSLDLKIFNYKQSSSDKEIYELLAKIFEDGLTKLKKYDGIIKTS